LHGALSLEPQIAKDWIRWPRLLQFYRAINLLYRRSVERQNSQLGAEWLDRGKPASLLELHGTRLFKAEVPRRHSPDVLITDSG